MLAQLNTFALHGIDAVPVTVEVDFSRGFPKTLLVGLPEPAVKESIHRIERAIVNLGYQRPDGRTIINLAPADLRKDAVALDLPIAVGLLIATGQVLPDQVKEYAIAGELSLDGNVRPIKGCLSLAMAAKAHGLGKLLLPSANVREAAVVQGVEVFGVNSLADAVGILSGHLDPEPTICQMQDLVQSMNRYPLDFADVRGQETAKRALVIAAGGGHNILMIGSPGSGKTMLSKRLPTILPPLTPAESLETSRIYSALGRLPPDEPLLTTRPFRSPHHTISDAGMVGGGSLPAPGEISLAHHGVLFLDELPEFNRRSLEVLRQPLEEGAVVISRALSSVRFPARFILVAAMNPCPCGYLGDPRRACKCSPIQVERYMSRVSGPMLDRIDIHIEVPAVPYEEMAATADGTASVVMREQVMKARAIQRERFGKEETCLNSRMSSPQIRKFCVPDKDGRDLLKTAMDDLGLSARAHDRILRMARTIADLESSEKLQAGHLAEAIGYRTLDRKLWAR